MVSHGCYLCPHPDPNGLTHPCYSCLPQQQSPLTKPAHILIQLTLPIRPISNNRQRGKRPLPNRTTFVFRFEGDVSSGSVSNSASSPGAATQHHSTRSDQPQTATNISNTVSVPAEYRAPRCDDKAPGATDCARKEPTPWGLPAPGTSPFDPKHQYK